MTIRVLIANESRLLCDSLRAMLDREKDIYVVGCATNSDETYFLLPHCNMLLMGEELADSPAIELLEDIRGTYPNVKVLVMGIDNQPETILRFVEAGAAGYILQNESLQDMLEKITAVQNEKAYVSPTVAALMMQRLAYLANLQMPMAYAKGKWSQLQELTTRECEILTLISEGCSNKQIADRLYIECGTVKNHVHNILRKLEITNRREAASLYQMHRQQFGAPLGMAAA